jgi:hypothetical protein
MIIPSGTAVRIAMAVVRNVPDNNGRMPYLFCVNNGVHSLSKRNSFKGTTAKNPHDSDTSTQMIPSVVRTVTSPQKASVISIIFSLVLFKFTLRLHFRIPN